MKLEEIRESLGLEEITRVEADDREVSGGYVSDLLSDVMAHAMEGDLWITLQTHLNIVAVSSMRKVAGVVIVNGRRPDEETVRKAETEGIPLFLTGMTAYETAGRLYQLLNRNVT